MSRSTADARLTRLLTMVPWVSQHDGPSVEEVCQRYGYTSSDLVADLELLFLCGLHPFTPDSLIEADIVDGRVWIRYADMLRPQRLNALEALGLLTAGMAVLAMPEHVGDQTLASALRKLTAALGIDQDEVVDIELDAGSPEILATIRRAIDEQRCLHLDYYSYGRDAHSRRRLEPYRLFNASGQWYLWAGVGTGAGEDQPKQGQSNEDQPKIFRVDRMSHVSLGNEQFIAPSPLPDPQVYHPRPNDPVVTLDLQPGAAWVADQYPIESRELLPDAILRVRLRVSEPTWMQRLLLRLGPQATVVAGEVHIDILARRILRRYEPASKLAPAGHP